MSKVSALSSHIHMSEVEGTFAICQILPAIGLTTGRVSYTLAKSQSVTHRSPDRPIGIADKEAGVMYRRCYLFTVIYQVKHCFHIYTEYHISLGAQWYFVQSMEPQSIKHLLRQEHLSLATKSP